MAGKRVLIMGAAGRDFHNFNVVYRDDPGHDVVAFTAEQIPNIAGRRYPSELAGGRYPDGIPIYPESELQRLKLEERPRIIQLISEARTHGDLSENSEYKFALEERESAELVAIDGALQRVADGSYGLCVDCGTSIATARLHANPVGLSVTSWWTNFRGLLPVEAQSAHWLAHPRFARAVEDYLERESAGVARYVNELAEHSPFRR